MEADQGSMESLHLTPEQQKVEEFLTEFSQQMVVMAFSDGNPLTNPSGLVKEIYRVCDEIMAGCLEKGKQLPCKEGCSWCCFLRVKATPLEVLGILDFLHSSLEPGEFSALRQRFADTDEITRGMDGNRRIRVKKICPLNEGGRCLVYPVRPVACRTFHSLDASDCESSLDDDQRSLRIRRDLFVIGTGVLTGLMAGLDKVGLKIRSLELIAGLRIAMEEPESTKKWMAGEPVFSEAAIKRPD